MAVLKSKAKFTEPFVGKREVIVMLSVQGGQATASATELDYDAVHALEQTIVDLTFVADTPQTETKGAGYCNECKWFRNKQVCGRCRSKNLFAEANTPQTESTGSPIGDYRDGVGAWQTDCPWK